MHVGTFSYHLKRVIVSTCSKIKDTRLFLDPSHDGSCHFSAIAYFLRSSGFDCSANQLRKEVVDYLKTHRKNEEGQPYELFAGVPWSSYLNEMRLNGTYGDHITLDATSRMYNVHIQVISSLGLQATVNINQENGQQTTVLRYYAEGHGDHYVCLRSTPNFDCSEYEYDEPISDIDNIQTELDELNLTNITVTWTTYKLNLTNIITLEILVFNFFKVSNFSQKLAKIAKLVKLLLRKGLSFYTSSTI